MIPSPGPYFLRIYYRDGRMEDAQRSDVPSETYFAHNGYSKSLNGIIRRIEIHDSGGPLETIWDRAWEIPYQR